MNDEQVQPRETISKERETIPTTADAPAHQPATAEEVRADVAAEAGRPVDGVEQLGAAADPAPADQAEALRNPRSDAEGAHEELHPAKDEPAAETKPMIPCPHAELSVDHVGKVTCDDCGTELALKKKDLSPHLAAPPSAEPVPIVKATPHEGTGDSRDTDKQDSAGNAKGDPAEEAPEPAHGTGPRGKNAPNESLADEEKRLRERLADIRSQRGMSNTDQVDSIGNAQHVYEQEPQGHDKHGMRLPDKNTGVIVESAPVQVGPRGVGAPPETFHGKRPNGRS